MGRGVREGLEGGKGAGEREAGRKGEREAVRRGMGREVG
jgi:hypothetical protein